MCLLALDCEGWVLPIASVYPHGRHLDIADGSNASLASSLAIGETGHQHAAG